MKTMEAVEANSDFVTELQDAMLTKFAENKIRLLEAYQRYRSYYDRKASAKPLQIHSHCLLLNPKLTSQNQFQSKSVQMWLPLYRVEIKLTDSNYIIRRVGTNFTQCVHRIRLKPIRPPPDTKDIFPVKPEHFERDPSRKDDRREPELFDDYLVDLLNDEKTQTREDTQPTTRARVRVGIQIGAAPAPVRMAPVPRATVAGHISPAGSPPNSEASATTVHSSSEEYCDNDTGEMPGLPSDTEDDEVTAPDSFSDSDQTEEQIQSPPTRPQTRSQQKNVTFSNWVKKREFTARYRGDSPERVNIASPSYMRSTAASRNKEQTRQEIIDSVRRSKTSLTPGRDTKLDQVRSSILRYQTGQPEAQPGTSHPENTAGHMNNIGVHDIQSKTKATFCQTYGNILKSKTSMAHCVSSDFRMSRGLASKVATFYPEIQQAAFRHKRLPVGSVFAFYDPYDNRYIFNLVTKRNFYEKPTHEALEQAIINLRFMVQQYRLPRIILPKLACGLHGLNPDIVYKMIISNLGDLPITIYHQCSYAHLLDNT